MRFSLLAYHITVLCSFVFGAPTNPSKKVDIRGNTGDDDLARSANVLSFFQDHYGTQTTQILQSKTDSEWATLTNTLVSTPYGNSLKYALTRMIDPLSASSDDIVKLAPETSKEVRGNGRSEHIGELMKSMIQVGLTQRQMRWLNQLWPGVDLSTVEKQVAAVATLDEYMTYSVTVHWLDGPVTGKQADAIEAYAARYLEKQTAPLRPSVVQAFGVMEQANKVAYTKIAAVANQIQLPHEDILTVALRSVDPSIFPIMG